MKQLLVVMALLLAVPPTVARAAPPGRGVPLLVDATPLAGSPGGSSAFTIRYRSTGIDGRPIETSGVVIVPRGPAPAAGRDIVAWAHGTTGIADACAPSATAAAFQITGLEALLQRGYVVVATDYEGLGTPGPHPYLAGPSAARSIFDAVRAARAMTQAAASDRAVVVGISQGGHAAL